MLLKLSVEYKFGFAYPALFLGKRWRSKSSLSGKTAERLSLNNIGKSSNKEYFYILDNHHLQAKGN